MYKTAAILIIGNEILSGRTQDVNFHFLANQLDELGILVKEGRIIADVEDLIIQAVQDLKKRYDYVFTTGGIGPTHDDITAQSIAKAFGKELVVHEEAFAILREFYKENFTPARQRMAYMPHGAKLICNPASKAPGFQMDNVYVMAGFPSIMREMFLNLAPSLKVSPPMICYTIMGKIGESAIAFDLDALQKRYPHIEIGSYPFYENNQYGVNISVRGSTDEQAITVVKEVEQMFIKKGVNPITGKGKRNPLDDLLSKG